MRDVDAENEIVLGTDGHQEPIVLARRKCCESNENTDIENK